MSIVGTIFKSAIEVLRKVVAWIVIACFVYMTVAVLAQVFGRYVFNYSISWTEETAKFAQIWVVLMGAGITMRRGLHVERGAADSQWPRRTREKEGHRGS